MASLLKNKKLRPWIIGGVVLTGALVVWMMTRGGSGGSGGAVSAGGPSEALQAAQLQASTAIALGQQAANVESTRAAGEIAAMQYGFDTQVALADIESRTAVYMAEMQSGIHLAGIAAQSNIAMAQSENARYVAEAELAYQTKALPLQHEFAMQQAAYDYKIAKKNSPSKSGQALGIIGGIVGGLFSDIRMKRDIVWTGESATREVAGRGFIEAGRYSWTYRGDGSNSVSHGVMAQEVQRVAPMAVQPTRRGRYLAVNYGALP